MAEMVRNKVDSGAYASESEVIRDGLRALELHDRALETWLTREVLRRLQRSGTTPPW